MTELLTAVEVAKNLKVSVDHVRRMTSRKEIPFIKMGKKSVRYSSQDIECWLRRCSVIERTVSKRRFAAAIIFLILLCKPAHAFVSEAEIPAIVNTIVQAESSGRPWLSGDHGKSRGLMQLQKGVWERYTKVSFDRAFDADMNRKIGEAHVRHIIKRYGSRASRALVIFTYNTGRFSRGQIPMWTARHRNNIYRAIFRECLSCSR